MKHFTRGRSSSRFHGGQKRISRPRRGQPSFVPSQFVKKATLAQEDVYVPSYAFVDFPLVERLKQAILKRGYATPTPIQDQAILPLLQGRDVVGIANTGTGKTAAFLIPLINKVLLQGQQHVLIVAPTRELAVQIDEEFRKFAGQLGLFSAVCIGGVNINSQIRALHRRPQFVIGTPGRLKDLEKQRVLHLSEYQSIVLDEVDRMLDMGFIHDIRTLISKLPTPRQSLFFSATLPTEAKALMQQFLTNPVTISVASTPTAAHVDQDVVRIQGKQKIDVLHELLIQREFEKVLVFGRTKWGIEKLTKALAERGFKVASIHGNKNQNQRQRAITQFRESSIQVLLATDVASRGLDIPNVTHVINYELPESYEDYIHRIGRTGRAEKMGHALTFID
jgi:superfamily II DNA/RNA helicase